MSQLSEREIEEAAREAGISPAELRTALAEQRAGTGALAKRSQRGVLPPSARGTTVAHAETSLPYPPEQAVRAVKQQIEREIGAKGHMMGSTEADIYDEPAGLIYRIQAEGDGSGAMVRIDVDPTPLRSRRTLTSMGLGASVGLFAIAGLMIPGLVGWALIAGAVGLTGLGATTMVALRTRAIKDARATMARALVEAESGAPIGGFKALKP